MPEVPIDRRDKAERLLNLTLALLATTKPLSKDEIFSTIPGYTGNSVAKERMFERDKDELRELGISVEVLPIDPYFEDELGYRILAGDSLLPEISFTVEESVWLSLMSNMIRMPEFQRSSVSGFQKLLAALSAPVEELLVGKSLAHVDLSINLRLTQLWKAIKERQVIQITYSAGHKRSIRNLTPYLITSRIGHWYLAALDHDDDQIKLFRVDRIDEIKKPPRSSAPEFHPVNDAELKEVLAQFKGALIPEVVIRLRKELSVEHPLVLRSTSTTPDNVHEEVKRVGEEITISHVDPLEIQELILWSGDSVEVLSPLQLRSEIVAALQRVVEAYS
jgi:proteasome accessory factor B